MYESLGKNWRQVRLVDQAVRNSNGEWKSQALYVRKNTDLKPLPACALRNILIHKYGFNRDFSIGFYDENREYLGCLFEE